MSASTSITRAALGGGGGNGGAGGNPAGNGANGGNGTGLDGDDGLNNGDAKGGKGGFRGPAGSASASGTAELISQINPDDQTVMEWTFIHNNVADLNLSGGAGGGGGGGGGELFMAPMGFIAGGNGGNGGVGATATGNLNTNQSSGCFVQARVVLQPNAPPGAGTTCIGSAVADIGWVSSGQGTLTNNGQPIWNRALNTNVNMNGVNLNIAGNGGTPVFATGTDGSGNFFQKSSTNALSAVNGTFSIGEGEFTATLTAGQNVFVNTGGNTTVSTITGNMNATGGAGGFGGQGGTNVNGANGAGGQTGGDGGLGGAGGPGAGKGGDGGGGFAGQARVGHEDGFFQGLIGVRIAPTDP